MEQFSDLLSVAIINLRESRQCHKLGTGSSYVKLQRKLPEMMLASYRRWIFENNRLESVETLREWIVQEAEFHAIVAEAIKGIQNQKIKKRSIVMDHSDQKISSLGQCKVCNGKHGVWSCEVFQRMDINNKWNALKKEKRCFGCLRDDHYSKGCKRKRKCGVHDCDKSHHENIGCNASGIDGGELGCKSKARNISVYSKTSDK